MFKSLNRKKSTLVINRSNNRTAKLLVSSFVMLFALLFSSIRFGFAQELAHKKIEEPAETLKSLPAKASKIKLEEVETKAELTVLVALESIPTLKITAKQKTRTKLNPLAEKSALTVKAKILSINSTTETD
jgi:hypothetical protein